MANYSNLLATIAANIYTNNNNEVTAAGVQAAVNAMVASLGAGYQFMGVAHPDDTPSGYADLRAFWLAGESGTYTNFGGLVLNDGEVAVIKYDGNGWSKEVTGAVNFEQFLDLWLQVVGKYEIQKSYVWYPGFVASNTIISSQLSQFCQPVLFKAGERIRYRTNATYSSAVVRVASNSPVSVGGTVNVLSVLINAQIANTEYTYTFEEDMWVVISVLTSDYTLNAELAIDGALVGNVSYMPLCVSRFDFGNVLPGADHNASWLSIVRRCDEVKDSVFCFANKTAAAVSNKFFDFYSVGTHPRTEKVVSELMNFLDYSEENGLSTSDCLLMPIIVGAVNNIDGDNPTEKWFTGGNHAYGNTATGAPTLREISNIVRIDGAILPFGGKNIRGNVCTIDLINNVQGYNTCKQNGGGREIIQQRAHFEITADHIIVTIQWVALESVIVYGPMYVSGMNVQSATGYRFVGSSTKRGEYVYDGANVPGDNDNKINSLQIITPSDYLFDTEIDLNYGLGNKNMENSPNCIVSTSAKGYLITIPSGGEIQLNLGDSIIYRVCLSFRKK